MAYISTAVSLLLKLGISRSPGAYARLKCRLLGHEPTMYRWITKERQESTCRYCHQQIWAARDA